MPISFKDLGEREILALAVSLEEEDGRIYGEFAEGLRKNFPATARIFETMRDEESEHRRRLLDQYKLRFGDHLPLIRRTDVKGFTNHKPFWLGSTLNVKSVRNAAAIMELETTRFYEAAAQRTTGASVAVPAPATPWGGASTKTTRPRPSPSRRSWRSRSARSGGDDARAAVRPPRSSHR